MRFTKQLVYGGLFVVVVGLILWAIIGSIYNPTPTCTDGRRNQGETDTDCGGPCVPCELRTLKPLQVQSKKVFKVQDGYGYAFEIVNPNGEWAASKVAYQIALKDSFGKNLQTLNGETFVYAGELKYIVEPYTQGNFQQIASIDVQFGQPEWRAQNEFDKPEVDVQNIRTTKENNQVVVTGSLVNSLAVTYKNPKVIAIVFNNSGSIIGASETQFDDIKGLETKQFNISFSKELGIYTPNLQPDVQFTATLKQGDTGPDVTKLQQALLEFGFIQRDPTGFYDIITADAVSSLQANNGIAPSGEFNDETRLFINSLLQSQVDQPSQQQLDTSVDTSKTRVFVEIKR
ncbi:hypothetical protein A2755_03780 [Candidatus Wolfebacteria bacterium RIFCSPHIGHO2_01_FULL_48_22]|uniref:Peptidoglycan binding-like domain-containing protein n=2 Tax=Candidatus Wolfeibacteriota TaxID=1752735 RepID=A0A1F8DNV2_9BACT|nr:MAG: hypothetical protein A2755_03780 [Candidatus Wolfebacteria bacterium RIFCSPHIGHO2_01_FULL_48_22]OGM93461.1 MAG: hypothetical protein A2935_01130 [Candidatus Wolfebacteria bacterium RIFCSPLOWO2_01_FULL_47_17b]